MGRKKPINFAIKWPKSEENQSILSAQVAQIHANGVIRRLSAENVSDNEKEQILALLLKEKEKTQTR